MATTPNIIVSAMLLFALLVTLSFDFTVGQIGVAYGRIGNNLLSPHDVVKLYKRHNIRRMRTYDPDSAILDALRGSGIELSAVITNPSLENLACYQSSANNWVRDHVVNFPDVNYKYISVGNEVNPADGATAGYAPFVLRAMRNIQLAICRARLDGRIKITTTIGMAVLSKSYPPEEGTFRDDVAPYLRPILRFVASTGAPFMANIYPYFAYINEPAQIDLGYALLEPNHGIWINGVYYDNLFYAMVDAVYAAIDRITGNGGQSLSLHKAAAYGNRSVENKVEESTELRVVAGETGFPTYGHSLASMLKAKTYNQNLVEAVKEGTPRHPEPIETYIFALFNENQKPGDETERHFGLFYPNGQPKYDMDFN